MLLGWAESPPCSSPARARIGLHGENGLLGASIDVGGRLGAVRWSGSSTDPVNVTEATVWHPWGGPVMAAGVSGSLGRFALSLGAEAPAGRSLRRRAWPGQSRPSPSAGHEWRVSSE